MKLGAFDTRSTGCICRMQPVRATLIMKHTGLLLKSRDGFNKTEQHCQWLVLPIRHVGATTLHSRYSLNRAMGSATSTSSKSTDSLSSFVIQRGAPLEKWEARPTVSGDELVLSTSRAASAGTTLITVPESTWISPETVSKSRIGKKVADLELWLQLALFLVAEREAPTSAFKGYINFLPSQPNLLVFWNNAELEELAGTQLLENVEAYK